MYKPSEFGANNIQKPPELQIVQQPTIADTFDELVLSGLARAANQTVCRTHFDVAKDYELLGPLPVDGITLCATPGPRELIRSQRTLDITNSDIFGYLFRVRHETGRPLTLYNQAGPLDFDQANIDRFTGKLLNIISIGWIQGKITPQAPPAPLPKSMHRPV